MKLKSKPDDFFVEELTSIQPQPKGPIPFYRMEKRSLSTPDAIAKLCRAWKIDSRRVRYGGLKDRHAWTIQYLTIEDGPARKFRDALFSVEHLGYVDEHYGPQSFTGNRFGITLRDIEKTELGRIEAALEEVRRGAVANYFDDQRFGSVCDQQYVARALIAGELEQALKLALCSYYEHDRGQEKQTKKLLRGKWGAWSDLEDKLPRNHYQRIARHLAQNPENWSGAFPLIPFFLRNMYLSAYQSYLWNSTLAEWMIVSTAPENLITIEMKQGKLPMIKQVPSEMDIDIPLPSSRYTLEDFAEFQPHLQRVLAREKLELRDIRLKQFREPFFSKGTRPAFYRPKELVQELGWDKMHKGHRKLKLSFCLPRGSYATMLVKRITTAEPWSVQNPTSSTTGSI